MRASLERQIGREPADPLDCLPPAIPDHTLMQRIGRGAYGEVWLARSALGTLRAVKIVYRNHFEDERPYQREFKGILKYEPVSRSHPGMIAVLHVGRNEEAGCFYYVMELADNSNVDCGMRNVECPQSAIQNLKEVQDVDAKCTNTAFGIKKVEPSSAGSVNPQSAVHIPYSEGPQSYTPRTLRSELARCGRFPPVEAAQLALGLADALAHLHAHGLVHRDVKPGNVIFVSGQPKLADIGLVTGSGDSRSFVGTEGFIPPEGPGTPQSDLYALGKLLYEAVTGRDRMDFPQLPPELSKSAEAEGALEINEVITRACAPDVADRYARATEFKADLNLFLAGRSLRHARKMEWHLAWFKRLAAAAGVGLVLAAVAVWVARNKAHEASERERLARERAVAEAGLRHRAEEAEHDAHRQLYAALLEQARATVHSGEMGQRIRTLDAIHRAAAISNTVELRREAVAAMTLPDLLLDRELPLDPGTTIVQLDPSFERVALSHEGGPIEIRAATDRRLLATLPPDTNLPGYFCRWSPDGRYLAFSRNHTPSGESKDLEVWDIPALRRVILVVGERYGIASFHPRLPRIMATLPDGALAVWDLSSGQQISRYDVEKAPEFVSFSPQGDQFVLAHIRERGTLVSVHSAVDGHLLCSHQFADPTGELDWHPSGRWIAVPDHGSSVHLMDAQSGDCRTLGRHKLQAVFATFSPDGRYLLSGGWERELICWDLQTQERAFVINANSFLAQFSGDGGQCAVVSASMLQIHKFEYPTAARDFAEDLGGRVQHAVFSPDGRWLAACGQARLGLWDCTSHGPGALLAEGGDGRAFFSPDAGKLCVSRDAGYCSWSLGPATNAWEPPRLEQLALQTPGGFTSLCLVSNQAVLSGSQGTSIVDLEHLGTNSGECSHTIRGINGASPDGRWLAIFRPYTPWLHVYSLPGLEPVAVLTNQANIREFEFSPGGDQVIIASNGRIEFWNTANWQKTREIKNFMRILKSSDERTCWLTKDYRTAGLYDAASLELLLPLPPGVLPLVLASDGRRLAVSVDARRVQVWDLSQIQKQLVDLGLGWERGL
jgi:WD40 repeat protein